ncbi:MAG: 4-hydroxy-tetrahydrodipicolinate reductase [Sedimentisphaerales bacterium]|nr:4-hydroxy-tetrahydrodipicolinate reductase [Sedimentisphaerales bacterium]
MKTKVIIVGAAGRMGKRFISLAAETGEFDIIGAVEMPGHPDLGKDAGLNAASGRLGVMITDAFQPVHADVAVDFSSPDAIAKTVDFCVKSGISLVSGTTGLSVEQKEKLKKASKTIPILYATNMSVGMNVLFALAGKAASMLGEDYDIEIIEQHHRFKKDAPSGSALTIAENICTETGRDFPDCLIHGRAGKDALRKKGEIGMHAIRAGDITGIHSVIFSCLGESFTFNHTAHSRDTLIRGALRAAKWLVSQKPALYSMADALGLK